MSDRALVKNAADPQQVKRAQRKERDQQARFLGALKGVLQTPEGRIVCREWIQRAGVYQSIWRPSEEIHYLSGIQDFGHRLMADCILADEDLYELMEREHRAYVKRENAETDAAHTARAETPQSN